MKDLIQPDTYYKNVVCPKMRIREFTGRHMIIKILYSTSRGIMQEFGRTCLSCMMQMLINEIKQHNVFLDKNSIF